MKHRQGYVSNSSSSSFIVAIPEKPMDVKHLKDMMFPPLTKKLTWCGFDTTVDEIVERVFKDIQSQEFTVQEVVDTYWYLYKNSFIRQEFECDKERNPELNYWDWVKQPNVERMIRDELKEFIDENKDSYMCTFRYADEEGDHVLEHGKIFRNFENITLYNH